jgi:hypothetical protein
MTRVKLFVLILILASLACTQAVTTAVTPTATRMAATRTAKPVTTAVTTTTPQIVKVSRPLVNVRKESGGEVVGTIKEGDTVNVMFCGTDPNKDNYQWCELEQPFGYVWQGCLTGLNKNLGCEAK